MLFYGFITQSLAQSLTLLKLVAELFLKHIDGATAPPVSPSQSTNIFVVKEANWVIALDPQILKRKVA